MYCNTGDWVEHCTALVEHDSGELELVEWSNGGTESLQRDCRWRSIKTEPRIAIADQMAALGVV